MKLSSDGGNVVGNKIKFSSDCIGISGGWTPMVHLFTQSGGKLQFKSNDNIFIPDETKTPSEQISVGSCNGDFELDDVVNNTVYNVKKFIGLDKSSYDKMKVICSKEYSKKNIWLYHRIDLYPKLSPS